MSSLTIGVIGDIHTEEKLLDKTVAFLKSKKLDNILCVGILLMVQVMLMNAVIS